MIELRDSARPGAALEALAELSRQMVFVQSQTTAPDRLNAWRSWSAAGQAAARAHFTEPAVREVVLGAHYALLQSVAVRDYGPGLASLIDAEISSRLEALDRAREQIESEGRSWGADCLAIVLDTSVLLEAGPRLAQIAWDDVLNEITRKAAFVIPIAAVEELDNLKDRGNAEPRNKARFALKWLGELVRSGNQRTPFPIATSTDSEASIRVWVDANDRVPLPEVDRDIIDRAQQLVPYTKKTVIASMDRSMVLRARAYGLSAVLVDDDHIPARASAATA